MKQRILILLSLIAGVILPLHADPPEDWNANLIDTTITVKNATYHVRRITGEEFKRLHKKHFRKPSEPVHNPAEVQKLLGENFKIIYMSNIYEDTENNRIDTANYFIELRKEKKFRFLVSPESEGLARYYPRERIILYMGGHSSDQAVFVDTGDEAYNPEYSAVSEDKRYRMAGLYSGQENVDYLISKYDPEQKKYQTLCFLYDITSQIPNDEIGDTFYSIHEQFIVGNTLYFRTGYYEEGDEENNWWQWYRYISITLPE